MLSQGEKLMLLVKRDDRDTESIAAAMDIDKSYLPKLYRMDKLPAKPLKRATEVFGVTASYFIGDGTLDMVQESPTTYKTAKNSVETDQLQKEITALQKEIAALQEDLRQERLLSANLGEALKNLSKK